jgi:hypothetical protein
VSEAEATDQARDTATDDAPQDKQDTQDEQSTHASQDSDDAAQESDDADPQDSGESGSDGDGGDDGDGPNSQVVEVAPDPERTGMHIEKPERADALSAEELEKIRQERLDPENRPDNVEVDNTQRTFDTDTGKFTDSDMEEDLGPLDDDAV